MPDVQKLFCAICSAFKCSFDEFVGEKVVISPSYSSAILGLPLSNLQRAYLLPTLVLSDGLACLRPDSYWDFGTESCLFPLDWSRGLACSGLTALEIGGSFASLSADRNWSFPLLKGSMFLRAFQTNFNFQLEKAE